MMPFKVFPATLTHDRQKVPLITGWQTQASRDPEQINRWRELYGQRLTFYGVPCGPLNDLLVLDIDVKSGGFETLKNQNLHIPDTLSQRTLNGGIHYFFKYPKDGRDHPNRVGLMKGLDVRSRGGWVAWYGLEADFNKQIAEAPAWLIADAAVKPAYQHMGPVVKVSPEIADGIIKASLDAIREAPAGESNNVLNTESFKLGQLVASESISRAYAEQVLFAAAKARGKPDYEAKATIHSGLDGGAKKPIVSPFGGMAPEATIHMVPPPATPARWTPRYFTKEDLLDTSKLRKPQLFQDWSTEDIIITTADGGTGKTTLKLFEAVHLALGERFLGFDCKNPGKTLFVTGEDTDKKLAAMLGAIMRQMGLFEERVGNDAKIQTILNSIVVKKEADLCLIVKDKQGFLSPNPIAMRQLLEAVEDIQPKMIVFDPISSFWGSEAALNDMAKAVTKFMSELAEKSHACVEMINHMGKQSSANKDMSQFAGRGGTGLPSNARVSRVLRNVTDEEYTELTGETLTEKQTAIVCNVNKFTDGSPLLNKPFIIVREGYIFHRKNLTPSKAREAEKAMGDPERIFTYIKEQRLIGKFPTRSIIVAHFMFQADAISEARTKRALQSLQYNGHMGEKIKGIENPDALIKEQAFVVTDANDKEI